MERKYFVDYIHQMMTGGVLSFFLSFNLTCTSATKLRRGTAIPEGSMAPPKFCQFSSLD
jgi:hypothetical protein